MKISAKERKGWLRELSDEARKNQEALDAKNFGISFLVGRFIRAGEQFQAHEGELMCACHALLRFLREQNKIDEGSPPLELNKSTRGSVRLVN